MRTNKLKLNDDKTDLLVLTAQHRNQPSIDKIIMGTEDIYPSDFVKNLGCIFDNTLTMKNKLLKPANLAFFTFVTLRASNVIYPSNPIKFLYTPSSHPN